MTNLNNTHATEMMDAKKLTWPVWCFTRAGDCTKKLVNIAKWAKAQLIARNDYRGLAACGLNVDVEAILIAKCLIASEAEAVAWVNDAPVDEQNKLKRKASVAHKALHPASREIWYRAFYDKLPAD